MQNILARGVGRRKEAVAQVQIVKGTGQFLINNIPLQQYLHNNTCSILSVKAPLNVLNSFNMNTETGIPPEGKKGEAAALATQSEGTRENQVAALPVSSPFGLRGPEGQGEEGVASHHLDLALDKEKENASFSQIDTLVKVKGGGLVGQAEAIKLGLARALCSLTITEITTSQDEVRKQLKDKGYLTQDSRVKERRKYGLKKARKATQYNKR